MRPMIGLMWALGGFGIALGIGIGGMANHTLVDAFVVGPRPWWPSLWIFIGLAMLPVFFFHHYMLPRMARPLVEEKWFFAALTNPVDASLLAGSAMVGAGWVLGGFCPGPSVAGMVTGHRTHVLFSYGMYVVMVLRSAWAARTDATQPGWPMTLALGMIPAFWYVTGPLLFARAQLPPAMHWPMWLSAAGAAIVGASGFGFAIAMGRPLGVSQVWRNILSVRSTAAERLAPFLFFMGFTCGGIVCQMLLPVAFSDPPNPNRSWVWVVAGGALSAYGSELANGCTCAHVIAGAPRLARRSVTASLVLFGSMGVLFQLERVLAWACA